MVNWLLDSGFTVLHNDIFYPDFSDNYVAVTDYNDHVRFNIVESGCIDILIVDVPNSATCTTLTDYLGNDCGAEYSWDNYYLSVDAFSKLIRFSSNGFGFQYHA
jgi:hypothetical protein